MKLTVWRSLSLAAVSVMIAFAAKVNTDYDRKVDFTRYHTYSVLQIRTENALWVDRIRAAIDNQLESKGLQRAPSGGDLALAAFGSEQNQQRMETFYSGLGGGWYWRGFNDGIATTTVENTPIGTLTVDLFDAQSKKLVWRGVASDVLSDKPEKNEKKLADATKDMFKHFPPKPQG